MEANKGDVPVYSASNDKNAIGYGFVADNLPNVRYFENCMTWNIDGSIGKVFIRSGRFTLSEKVIPLILFDKYKDKLNYSFLKVIIESKVTKENFGFSNKAGKEKLGNLSILIPTLQNGEFDLEYQDSVVEKYNIIAELRQKIGEYRTQIETLNVSDNGLYETNFIQENLGGTWLEYISTKTGWTKTDLVKIDTGNIDNIPVFSAAKQAVAYVNCEHRAIIMASKEQPLISFASNGDGSAGANLIFHTSPFFVSNDRTVIRIVNPKINSKYVFHQIQDMKKRYGFNHAIKATKNNLGRVIVNFPITETNDFNFDMQSQIAERYEQIESIKRLLLVELNKLQEVDIVVFD